MRLESQLSRINCQTFSTGLSSGHFGLCEGQKATVLTLPTQPKTAAEADAQRCVAHVG
jgi:hypothetical protein